MRYVTAGLHIKDADKIADLLNAKDEEGFDFLFMVNYGAHILLTFRERVLASVQLPSVSSWHA